MTGAVDAAKFDASGGGVALIAHQPCQAQPGGDQVRIKPQCGLEGRPRLGGTAGGGEDARQGVFVGGDGRSPGDGGSGQPLGLIELSLAGQQQAGQIILRRDVTGVGRQQAAVAHVAQLGLQGRDAEALVPEALASLATNLGVDDVVLFELRFDSVLVGRAALRDAWAASFARGGEPFAIEDRFAAGDRVVQLWRVGTVRGVDVLRVRDGRISEKLGYVKTG